MSKVVKSKIRCVVTGEEVGVRPHIFDKRVAKFGSVEALLKGYISSMGKRMLRDGMSVTQIRTQFGNADDKSLPTVTSITDMVTTITSKKNTSKATAEKKTSPTSSTTTVEDSGIDPDVEKFLGGDLSNVTADADTITS